MSDTEVLEEMLSAVSEEESGPRITLGDVPFTPEGTKVEATDADLPIEEIAKNALSKDGYEAFLAHMKENAETPGDSSPGALGTLPLMSLSLTDTHIITKVGGIDKAIEIQAFLNVLAAATNSVSPAETLLPLQLPSNVLNYAGSDKTMYINTYHPGCKRKVSHLYGGSGGRATPYEVPFPNMILFYTLTKREEFWNVSDIRYFITPKKLGQLPTNKFIAEEDRRAGIFRTPFPNFYDDGRMCYGGNSMPSRHSSNLRGLDYYFNVIFLSNFNDDLGVRGLTRSFDPRGWFEHLATLEEFPYQLLRS